ncbi:PDZ domain-containing protein [Brevibacterium sp.]|mgnify:CR=1 FL=1|uniref:YlbL family protein n=1 Tax=Brevibacterium sp. TaxID=1701 RepID=UPI0025BA9466|nr:PDZ domain-containing protein [Brevibacterium sp.]
MSSTPPAADPSQSADGVRQGEVRRTRRLRRPGAVGVSSFLLYALVFAAALIPVPYLLQMPGPVVNTLEPYEGRELITISGTQTYEAEGQLDMLTVAVAGGPGRSVYASNALGSLVKGSETVVPSEAFYPLETTREQVSDQNSADMVSSQDEATAAALGELGIDFSTVVGVSSVAPDSAAAGAVEPGDLLLKVDGTPVEGSPEGMAAVKDAVASSDGPVALTVQRDGEEHEVEVEPHDVDGTRAIGVVMGLGYSFPFDVEFAVEGIGGPSAGTIFALTIIDKLTEGNLTGGVPIAGTGAIDAEGVISPIGGARQKVVAAAAAGAEYFLSPADNCAEVLSAPGAEDLTVVRVDDLHEARAAVEDIAADEDGALPSCAPAHS